VLVEGLAQSGKLGGAQVAMSASVIATFSSAADIASAVFRMMVTGA
jgi:hypothetical protein